MKELITSSVNLSFCRYRFEFEASGEISFSEFNGSAWRGLFGHALRKTVCVTGKTNCKNCLVSSNCAYAYIFETSPGVGADRMRNYTSVPHPFIIKNPGQKTIHKGDHFNLDLTLIGKANQYLAYILQTFIKAGNIGIKKDRIKFIPLSLSQFNSNQWIPIWTKNESNIKLQKSFSQVIPPMPEAVKISFITPLNIMREGKLVTAMDFKFSNLFHSLSRRISMLAYFHDGVDFKLDYKGLLSQADRVETIDKNMEPVKWKRYSSRQNKIMDVKGIKGRFQINLTSQENLWPFIWLGSHVHAGKLTSMGLGEYQIHTLASLPTE